MNTEDQTKRRAASAYDTHPSLVRIYNPFAIFIQLLLIIFLFELLIMFFMPKILQVLQSSSQVVESFVDATLLTVISSPFVWLIIARPLRNAAVQERRRAEAIYNQLLATREELVRSEKLAMFGQLSGSVAHELRNPLGVMSNAVYYLRAVMSEADATVSEYLEIIQSEISKSQKVLSDLLEFSHSRAPRKSAVSVDALIEESLKGCAIPENIPLRVDLPATLPKVAVDPQQMAKVFHNLILNAVQAMPDGGALKVAGRLVGAIHELLLQDPAHETGDFIEISVADAGEGISPENMKRLFQPLFTTKARGTGLGLVVCRNLVEANGGRIEVGSRTGAGTTFTVVLPTVGGES
jgi:signal transduction histidine kinase